MKAVTVLMYHAIVDGEMEGADSHYSVPPATFARQLQLIRSHGRRICSVHQLLYEGLPASGEPWPVCLTFDDGHLTNAPAAEAIAREEGRAEFFVNPSMVGKPGFLDWPALREMAAMGMAIQSHGMNHRYLDQLSPAEVRAELADSKAAIEDAIGSPVTVYAPAGGRMPENFLSLAGSLGYHAVCSSRVGIWRALDGLPLSPPAPVASARTTHAPSGLPDTDAPAGIQAAAPLSGTSHPGNVADSPNGIGGNHNSVSNSAAMTNGPALELPRLAMLRGTSEARFLAWITQQPLEMLKQQTRYRVLRLSKQLLGNGGHEKLRALLLRSPRTEPGKND